MSDSTTALAILDRAMAVEEEGRAFYEKAAKTTQDAKGREIFQSLANDEIHHHDVIQRQRDSLVKSGKFTADPAVKAVKLDLSKRPRPFDRKALEASITEKSNDWDAIVFGLDIEVRSFELYNDSAEQTDDPQGKQMYEFLAGEEMNHYTTLITRYEQLFGTLPLSNR